MLKVNNANPSQLMDELIEAGIKANVSYHEENKSGDYTCDGVMVEVTEGSIDIAKEIISSHTPRPPREYFTDQQILGQQMTERELEAILQGQQITDVEIRVLMLEMGANPL